MKIIYITIYAIIILLLINILACKNNVTEAPKTLFTMLDADKTGIDFANTLDFNADFNVYKYRNFYNGGGVALGDINNDGLLDIYLTSNMHENKLYLNKGNWQFEDITNKAGVAGKRKWSTGVTMADVNADGFMDIYVCNSGDIKGDNRENELFINNGNGTFKEQAHEYGLADRGLSTHAAFFDYDNDGDLDCYLLNNSYRAIGSFNLRNNIREVRDSLGGDKLFRNDNNHFTDVSVAAGIYGSVIGFGLGVTVGDVNQDGWLDIYVSNDFFERDYLYINNHDGTFREELEKQMRHISQASMGADFADVNNDAYPDLFATDMLPESNHRLKMNTTFDSWNNYQFNMLDNGYYHQFTRNMLQLNNGDNTFSEIGCFTGIEATDWSWSPLIADYDNDGWKDIFVANGIYQDLTEQDYILFASDTKTKQSVISGQGVDYKKLIEIIPSVPVANYMFHNTSTTNSRIPHFKNVATDWGLATAGFSNGSAYGDIDNDGDLDLIVNNVNMPVWVYENNADSFYKNNHWLKLILKGDGKNPQALGTKIIAKAKGKTFYLEQLPMRGFQSTVDNRPNFGLGDIAIVDSLIIQWPNQKVQVLTNVKSNQILTLHQKDATLNALPKIHETASEKPIFKDITNNINIHYKHQENQYSDFDNDRLLYMMLSYEGPKIAKGDVNGDGLEDFYVGGAFQQSGSLMIQKSNGTFTNSNMSTFAADTVYEDTDAAFFDIDGDKDLDLYVGSGGNEAYIGEGSKLDDRLYINDGKGNFKRNINALPHGKPVSTACVRPADYDGDGDTDVFIGIRFAPGAYGKPVSSILLENDGNGNLQRSNNAPDLKEIGMITDAVWSDIDGDKDLDLLMVGDYMPIIILENNKGILKRNDQIIPKNTNGWWRSLQAADLDGDGDDDYILGNFGLNSRFKASEKEPITQYVNDFDNNGMAEQIICQYNNGTSYPIVLKHDLTSQIPSLRNKFLQYKMYADKTINDIFSKEQLEKAYKMECSELRSAVLINNGSKGLELRFLPDEAQLAPIYAIQAADYDADGKMDLLLCGNFFEIKPEYGRIDANYGVCLKGDGKGNFNAISNKVTNFRVDGEVRDMKTIKTKIGNILLIARNNMPLQVFKKN